LARGLPRTTVSHPYIDKTVQKKEAMAGEFFLKGKKLGLSKIYHLEKF
jgi:hypothetical protein